MLLLQVQHLHKAYRAKGKATHAVQDVSLQIGAQEVLAFLGPNGAGKTTTIKMIAGLVVPDRGTVSIAGRDPHRDPQALRSVGAVLEGSRNLYWRLTPAENLEYFGVLRGLSRRVARQRARVLLDRFELSHKSTTNVQKLSRGMQQKVAIAVALIHEPPLLLLDEPTLGLDVEATQTVKRLVREIASEGRAILLTTHQLDLAEELSDRVAIINQGKIVTEQPTQTLLQQFSSAVYRVELPSLPDDRVARLIDLGALIEGTTIHIPDPTLLYPVLDILKPLPIVRLETERATLTDIFLKLTQATPEPMLVKGGVHA
ncbi:ABC transporter ATP-binding protein [Stenomitos frigidus]|uniref:ABC transporter ATP-binding protein n=1 Tax=Stenomitos frigidus ULC18 TaxID=2107698 RepID=A0A2T1EGD3_9CYAN|nr:ABC transporter ATP-binding protein [Stenomitos frigidus]PSB31745.1 ABC transporter ATP-binding protein [Stenomitos frigidus ULC18]